MKVEPPKSAFAQQPQLNTPTQITPKVIIHPLAQPTPMSKIKAAEHTLVEISKDALNKGEEELVGKYDADMKWFIPEKK
ncbi:hypothetical protein [Neisseria sp. Ec49-e6-T10]|uniref:hypothetical protein n=1 Tax=Neisseria sp. Ec49-e6-T10 TaxID=3140744 RepID=UPI003EBFF7AE